MKQGYTIKTLGTQRPECVLVYNWLHANEVLNVRYNYLADQFIAEGSLVAIFKIKWKS